MGTLCVFRFKSLGKSQLGPHCNYQTSTHPPSRAWKCGVSTRESLPEESLLATPKEPRHQVRKYSGAEYYTTAGFRKTNAQIKEWKQANNISQVESNIGSAKTASQERLLTYIQRKMAALDPLLAFYGRAFQLLKFLNYRGRQKADNEMIKIFLDGGKKYGPHPDHGQSHDVYLGRQRRDGSLRRRRRRPREEPGQGPEPPPKPANKWRPLPFEQSRKIPLLCIGDGSFDRKTYRNKPHGLAKRFKKAVRQAQRQHALLVVDVHEAWTSQVCSSCGTRSLQNLQLDENDAKSKLHAVVHCNVCDKLWQRDVNASRNIRSLALFAVFGYVPRVFTHESDAAQRQGAQNNPDTENP